MCTGPIFFPGGSEWGAIGQVEAKRLARSPRVKPLYLRVVLAAIAWSNRVGHAEFASSGLRHELVIDLNESTGEVAFPRPESVSRAIKQAIEMELLHPSSCARCLVLQPSLWQKEGKGSASCGWHGVNKPGYQHAS